jgi:hypothetical protein
VALAPKRSPLRLLGCARELNYASFLCSVGQVRCWGSRYDTHITVNNSTYALGAISVEFLSSSVSVASVPRTVHYLRHGGDPLAILTPIVLQDHDRFFFLSALQGQPRSTPRTSTEGASIILQRTHAFASTRSPSYAANIAPGLESRPWKFPRTRLVPQ